MKLFLISYVLPLIVAVVCFLGIVRNRSIDNFFPPHETTPVAKFNYIENFHSDPSLEDQFLRPEAGNEVIYLLGSSELANSSAAIPYNFISTRFNTKVKGVGHAGNQCLSIYSQLMAKDELLNNSKIVIIISPGWFESKTSRGTSSKIFLEFNSERFLSNIVSRNTDFDYKSYLFRRLSQLYPEFSNPNIPLRLANFKYRASKSFVHRFFYQGLITLDEQFVKTDFQVPGTTKADVTGGGAKTKINWDSLFQTSRKEVLDHATNNNMGINNEYFSEYINGKVGHVEPVSPGFNQELFDFYHLVDYLKLKKANASFIISPLNPFYYKNITTLAPTVDAIRTKLQQQNFLYLNLFTADTSRYDKAVLSDVMHMSDFGWYKVDSFIVRKYNLEK